MKLHATLLALAVTALFSSSAFAFGDDAVINSTTTTDTTVNTTGTSIARGRIAFTAQSGATVDQDQLSLLNLILGDGDTQARVMGDALSGAEGNIQVNVGAGAGNLQANDAALSALDDDAVFASAQVFSSQVTGANITTDFPSGPHNELIYSARVGDNVLSDASGNIGLNVAAGAGNAQSNALAASVNSGGTLALASADSEQASVFNVILALSDLDNTATLDGRALSNAIGNIGVNIASGAGNAQHNGTSIAIGGGL